MDPLDAYDRILRLLHEAALDDARLPAATAVIDEAAGSARNVLVVGGGAVGRPSGARPGRAGTGRRGDAA